MAEPPRVIFASGFESLFSRALRQRVTPELDAQLQAIGLYLDRPFQPAYEIETWASAVGLVAQHLYPDDPTDTAYWKLGRSTVEGFEQTLVGKAAFSLLRLIGPARTLERATRTFAATNNYTRVELTRLGPTTFDFTMNEQHTNPYYDMGIVAGALELVGARSLVTTLVARNAEGFTMRLEWSSDA